MELMMTPALWKRSNNACGQKYGFRAMIQILRICNRKKVVNDMHKVWITYFSDNIDNSTTDSYRPKPKDELFAGEVTGCKLKIIKGELRLVMQCNLEREAQLTIEEHESSTCSRVKLGARYVAFNAEHGKSVNIGVFLSFDLIGGNGIGIRRSDYKLPVKS